LEWETGENERARVLLLRARERATTDRVFMKSAILERECKNFEEALKLIEEGIREFPSFEKFYMMGGQISKDDINDTERARSFFQRGLRACPKSIVLWILASELEERMNVVKARSIFDLSRLKNPQSPMLWVHAVRLERRVGNEKLAFSLMAKALQECPNSGLLRAEAIKIAARPEKKARCADAIKRCPDDPLIITAVASLFATERKYEKARKWLERAVALNADLGDSWAHYLAFEYAFGTVESQERIIKRCVKAEPKHGELWCKVAKNMANRKMKIDEILILVARGIEFKSK